MRMSNTILPDSILNTLDSFTKTEATYAIDQAKAWRKNNRYHEVSIECNIATYRFKWTKCGNMHLIDVIKKGER